MGQSDPIAARHEAAIEQLAAAARDDDRVLAAWLQGSRADGSADEFSDIDFYVAVNDDAFPPFDKLAFIERAAAVLVHMDLPAISGVVCLLAGPVKLDFFAERASAVADRPRPAVRILVDKAGLAENLKTGWQPSDEEIARRIDELVRMTYQGATWPVRLLRRGQWMTQAFSELTLIHNVILPLMLVQHDRRAFHRNQMTRERLLPDAERGELDALAQETLRALASRSLAEAYRSHLHVHETLARVARAACAAFGLEYPAAEREVLAFYEREWPR
jgi:predicted nucleotidyltransferase